MHYNGFSYIVQPIRLQHFHRYTSKILLRINRKTQNVFSYFRSSRNEQHKIVCNLKCSRVESSQSVYSKTRYILVFWNPTSHGYNQLLTHLSLAPVIKKTLNIPTFHFTSVNIWSNIPSRSVAYFKQYFKIFNSQGKIP